MGQINLIFFIVAAILVLSNGMVREKRQAKYFLSDRNEDLLVKPMDTSFVCSDEGIYADINNDCQMFHICVITDRPDGSGADLRQYSFVCGNQTVFSQFTMTCTSREEALPCEYAPEFYDLNKRAQEGRKEVLLNTDPDVDRFVDIKAGPQ